MNRLLKRKLPIRVFYIIAFVILGLLIIRLVLTPGAPISSIPSAYEGERNGELFPNNPNNKKVIVFVHGVGGNVVETWQGSDNTRFPELAFKDPKLKEFDVFIPTYYISENSKNNSSIFELAQNLNTVLENQGIFSNKNKKTASKYNEVYFVTHSMGNIVTRTMLTLRNAQADHTEVPLIISFASPSNGSQLAELSNLFIDHPQLNDMNILEKNSFLSLLNQIWLSKPYDTEIACAYESKPISETDFLVVTKESATSVCTRADKKELEEDHFSIVKPQNTKSESYIWFVEQLTKKAAKKGWELDRWSKNEIILGGKDYPESNIHMAMIALILEDSFGNTFKVKRKYKSGDGRKVFNDLKSRDIDIYVEYSGSVLFGYLDNDPIDFKNKFNNDYKLAMQHKKDELNKKMQNSGLNMVFYSQLGFDSPFQLIMNKENAKKLNLIFDDKVTLSNLIEKNNNCKILGETGFFHRNDGYIGLKKHYDHINENFNFLIKYSSHVDTYDFFKKEIIGQNCEYDQIQKDYQKCAVGVSYATDPELFEEFFMDKLIKIEDDKKFFPIHFPGVLAHSFLEKKFPEIKEVLSEKLQDIITDIEEMAQLNRVGTAIWKNNESEFEKEIENMVRDFLIKKGAIKNTNRIESADSSSDIGV